MPGEEEPLGFARRSTERVADELDLPPEVVSEGVPISAGQTERIALVFEVVIDIANPSLVIGDASLPLRPAIDGGVALDELPDELFGPGETARQVVESVVDGGTLALGSGATESPSPFSMHRSAKTASPNNRPAI